MASILDKFGIKEVGDVTFYHLNTAGKPDYPVLYLDTCTVTTLEQTADEVEAKGGKGNVSLMVWDTNKELNVTLEDALFSTKSMAIMFGNGTATKYGTGSNEYIMKSETFTCTADVTTTLPESATTIAGAANTMGWNPLFVAPDGKTYLKKNAKFYDENGTVIPDNESDSWTAWESPSGSTRSVAVGDLVKYTASGSATEFHICTTAHTEAVGATWNDVKANYGPAFSKDSVYFCAFDLSIDGAVISINKDSFPGSYYVTIDTYARMQGSGADDFFQLIMPNCKVLSENSIEMSSDGDPSVLSMNLKVMKPADGGAMVYMVKYGLTGDSGTQTSGGLTFSHNHVLNENNEASGD